MQMDVISLIILLSGVDVFRLPGFFFCSSRFDYLHVNLGALNIFCNLKSIYNSVYQMPLYRKKQIKLDCAFNGGKYRNYLYIVKMYD